MRHSHMPASKCPRCGNVNDMATNMASHRPKPGDYSICLTCQVVNRFDSNLELRSMTPEEEAELKTSDLWPEVMRHQLALVRAKALAAAEKRR